MGRGQKMFFSNVVCFLCQNLCRIIQNKPAHSLRVFRMETRLMAYRPLDCIINWQMKRNSQLVSLVWRKVNNHLFVLWENANSVLWVFSDENLVQGLPSARHREAAGVLMACLCQRLSILFGLKKVNWKIDVSLSVQTHQWDSCSYMWLQIVRVSEKMVSRMLKSSLMQILGGGGVENIDLLWKQHFIVKCFRNDTGWSRRVLRTFYESFDKSWLTV